MYKQIFYLLLVASLFFSDKVICQSKYSASIVKMGSNDEIWETSILSLSNLVFKFDNTFGLYLKGNLISEDVIIEYYGFGNSVSICFKEEKWEYNYYTNEDENVTVYEDCYSASVFIKTSLNEVIPYDAIIIDSDGNELDIGEYILIPCDNDCFN